MIPTVEELHIDKVTYMESRRGSFEFRSRTRYCAVANMLFTLGLKDGDILVDIGAGSCQFDHYLRTVRGWSGRYLPVDAVVCGSDLNVWKPAMKADFTVCIEVLEHLESPERMVTLMQESTKKGVVATTPNGRVIDVIACDPTHLHSLVPMDFFLWGFNTETRQFFNKENDSILAWWFPKPLAKSA
jgi:hypothetical protein